MQRAKNRFKKMNEYKKFFMVLHRQVFIEGIFSNLLKNFKNYKKGDLKPEN